MVGGDIYTVAGNGHAGDSGDGGPAIDATFDVLRGVSVDPSGNLVIADEYNDKIRVVAERTGTFYGQAMTAGNVYTVAGTGTAGYSGDGGPATAAKLTLPTGDGAGRCGQPGHRRQLQPPDPGGGGKHRHVLRTGDDRRRHLHRGRQW